MNLVLGAWEEDDPPIPAILTQAGPRGVLVTSMLKFRGPRSSLGWNLDVHAPKSQSPVDSLEKPRRPVMISRRFVRHIADTCQLGCATRSSHQEGTVLEYGTPSPALRAADDLDALRYDIFRIGVRKA